MFYTGVQMPRYLYDKLTVACLEPRHYPPHEIRQAVEYLKTLEQKGFTGLRAEVDTTAGRYKLRAMIWLQLSEIVGRAPRGMP